MTSGGHGLQITDDYSKQECLVLTPTMISLKQKYFSDLPYPRYQLKHSSGPMIVASCWSVQKEDICPSIKKSMDNLFLWEKKMILRSKKYFSRIPKNKISDLNKTYGFLLQKIIFSSPNYKLEAGHQNMRLG